MTDPAAGNWGRWGPADERGAANLMTAASVLAALSIVREGRVLSLAQPLDDLTPMPAGKPAPTLFMLRDGGDYATDGRLLGRSRFSEDVLTLSTHAGTHIDSLAHVWYGEQLYNGFPQESLRSRGASRCGIDKLGAIVGRGVLLDVAEHLGVPALAKDVRVSAELLQACAAAHGVDVRSGDVVLLRTGWLEGAREEPARYLGGEPGLDLSGARWLADADVLAIGVDNYAVEVLEPHPADGFPVHELLLRDHGIPLFEGLVLGELAQARAAEVLFIAAPLPIRGGTASPVNPIVVL